jgi:DNA (cytosine-5)-methyltransferase 1
LSAPRSYYNEIEPAAAHVLRCLIRDGVIAPGYVDERSIKDVQPEDLIGFTQAHFFAGGGLWSVAARLAGWPDDRSFWSGSCPCQPFSVAGKGAGTDDARHLWPDFHRLIRACRPAVVVGEQVAGKAGVNWFHGVRSDLEGDGYAGRAVVIPACAVDAPHIRERIYWLAVADAAQPRSQGRRILSERAGEQLAGAPSLEHAAGERRGEGRPEHELWSGRDAAPDTSGLGDPDGSERRENAEGRSDDDDRADAGWKEAASRFGVDDPRSVLADADFRRRQSVERGARICGTNTREAKCAGKLDPESFWSGAEWITGADGKARRVEPGIRLLANGVPGRVAQLRIGGNAIVAPLAAEVLAAYLETEESL